MGMNGVAMANEGRNVESGCDITADALHNNRRP